MLIITHSEVELEAGLGLGLVLALGLEYCEIQEWPHNSCKTKSGKN